MREFSRSGKGSFLWNGFLSRGCLYRGSARALSVSLQELGNPEKRQLQLGSLALVSSENQYDLSQ